MAKSCMHCMTIVPSVHPSTLAPISPCKDIEAFQPQNARRQPGNDGAEHSEVKDGIQRLILRAGAFAVVSTAHTLGPYVSQRALICLHLVPCVSLAQRLLHERQRGGHGAGAFGPGVPGSVFTLAIQWSGADVRSDRNIMQYHRVSKAFPARISWNAVIFGEGSPGSPQMSASQPLP